MIDWIFFFDGYDMIDPHRKINYSGLCPLVGVDSAFLS